MAISDLVNNTSNLYGIALAYQSEVNSFFNNYLGVDLFGSDEGKCKINDIPLEWVYVSNDERSSTIKTHSLEDRDSTLISSNISLNNRKYSIQVLLTPTKTKNSQQIYEEIVELWQKKEICTLTTDEHIEDIVITKISNTDKTPFKIEFDLDLEVLEFAYLMRKGEVLEEDKTILNKEQKTGICGTKESNISWGGFL